MSVSSMSSSMENITSNSESLLLIKRFFYFLSFFFKTKYVISFLQDSRQKQFYRQEEQREQLVMIFHLLLILLFPKEGESLFQQICPYLSLLVRVVSQDIYRRQTKLLEKFPFKFGIFCMAVSSKVCLVTVLQEYLII